MKPQTIKTITGIAALGAGSVALIGAVFESLPIAGAAAIVALTSGVLRVKADDIGRKDQPSLPYLEKADHGAKV